MFFRFRSLHSMAMCVWGSHLYHSTFTAHCMPVTEQYHYTRWLGDKCEKLRQPTAAFMLKSPSAATAFGAHIVFLVCNGHPILIDIKIFLSPFGIELYCILSESGMCSPVQFVRNELAFGFSGSWH